MIDFFGLLSACFLGEAQIEQMHVDCTLVGVTLMDPAGTWLTTFYPLILMVSPCFEGNRQLDYSGGKQTYPHRPTPKTKQSPFLPFTGCNKEIICACITEWFGSTEAFEHYIQTDVTDVLVYQLHWCTFRYPWSCAIATCLGHGYAFSFVQKGCFPTMESDRVLNVIFLKNRNNDCF